MSELAITLIALVTSLGGYGFAHWYSEKEKEDD